MNLPHRGGGPNLNQALGAFLALPLRPDVPLDKALRDEISDLDAQVHADAADQDALVDDAERLLLRVIEALDEELRRTQASRLELEERANLLRQDPPHRRRAEQARRDALAEIQTTVQSWVDRSERQRRHMTEACAGEMGRGLEIVTTQHKRALSLSIGPAFLSDLAKYLEEDACGKWTGVTCDGVERALVEKVTPRLAAASEEVPPLQPPVEAGRPLAQAELSAEGTTLTEELPALPGLVLRDLRGGVMIVGFALTAVGGAILSPELRPYLIIGAIPILAVPAYLGAKRHQDKARDATTERHRKTVVDALTRQIERALQGHKRSLERWLKGRREAWERALGAWFADELEPTLAELDIVHRQERQQVQVELAQVGPRAQVVGGLCSELRTRTLVDVRKLKRARNRR